MISSKIFTAVADAAEWIIKQKDVHDIIQYLDDYLLVSDLCIRVENSWIISLPL